MDNIGIIKYRDYILQKCAEFYSGDYFVAIVGSRVRDDWTEDSDFDVIIATHDDAVYSFGHTLYDGKRFVFSTRAAATIAQVREFDLSYFNLNTNELYVGADDEAYRLFQETQVGVAKVKPITILPTLPPTFEELRDDLIAQMSAEVYKILTASDWGEIRQADPTEPTRMSDEEFLAYREKRKAIRKFFEDYKTAILLLTNLDAIVILHKTKLVELELLK